MTPSALSRGGAGDSLTLAYAKMGAADVADKVHIKLEWKYNGEGYTEVFYKMVAQIVRRVAKMVQLYQAEALMTKLLYKPGKVEMHAQGSE